MAGADWQISGEYMESCNCDYLCPCIYTNPQAEVTYEHAQSAGHRLQSPAGHN